jgi:ferredoxin
MLEIKINNKTISANPDETILNVAKRSGIHIPTMCWIKDFTPSTSCMVCLVQDMRNGKMLTSCAAKVEEGMDIITDNDEVLDLRRSALELLLSEHNGDCEAPCQRVCPAEMDIPQMNRLISENKIDEAIKIVKETIALPAILGYICPAPCEKACRRKEIDEPVSICLLKRFVAEEGFDYSPVLKPKKSITVAVIGSGPAGLAAAFYLVQNGFTCHIYDNNVLPGGKLRTDIAEEILPREVLDKEIETIQSLGVEFFQNQTISSTDILTNISKKYQFIVITTGSETTINTTDFEKTDFSELKEFDIFKVNDCYLFAPKQVSSKSKMAVRAVAVGRKSCEWIMEFVEKQKVSLPDRKFNSVYKRITLEEQVEFLKDAKNHLSRQPIENKLQGFTKEQAIKEAERCLHCDCRKKDDCVLRDLSSDYNASQRTYTLSSHKKTSKNTDNEQIVFENLKCIKCGICIQTAQDEGDKTGFAYHGRGFDVCVTIPIEKNIRELTENTTLSCAKNCPTGAISLKHQLKIDK